jgi:phosphoribosylformylglycinamidine cyclo-ligase
MLPNCIVDAVKKDSYPLPPIFEMLQKDGGIADEMMYNTYNMGLGMVLAVDPADAEKTIAAVESAGEKAFIVGKTESAGEKGVRLC